MDKVELKVNVINQLKLLRQSTFKDILCFLDEDIQNAQRAKATEVRITVNRSGNTVTIENNGKVLNNPQALFSIAESEWDEDVNKSENPFGMGFFSNITVSNLIKVHTGNKLITFDIENMISTNDTEIKVEEVEEEYKGFKLTLEKFDFETCYYWNIEERVKILGKYIHELDVYYNDELQVKKDLTSGDNSNYLFAIDDDEDFKGWIALANNYSFGSNLNVFYKGRLVSKLEGFPYLKGDLHISDKTLNLTSPDRKDIIKDEKLSDFKILVKLYVQDYCNELVITGQDDIREFSNSIGYYTDKKKIKNSVKFMTFRTSNEDDMEYLKGIAIVRNQGQDIETFNGYELFLKNKKQNESIFNEVTVIPVLKTKPKEATGQVIHEGSSHYSNGYVEEPEIKESDLIEEHGEKILDNTEPVFFIKFNEVNKYECKLNIAKHYNLRIIVARNDVEASILRDMKTTDSVLHISELQENVTVVGSLSNTALSSKENRAIMIFGMISSILGFDYNVFAIGDLMVTKIVKVESLDTEETIIDPNVVALKDTVSKKVYVDRSIINQYKLREDTNESLDVKDYQFILANFKNIVKEISLLTDVSKDKTEDILLSVLGNAI